MMLLQIYFDIAPERGEDFQRMYETRYVPALNKQKGYIGSRLLRVFPPEIAQEMGFPETEFNYQMELIFDSEENRRLWVASPEHQEAWPLAQALARNVAARGYDVLGRDGDA